MHTTNGVNEMQTVYEMHKEGWDRLAKNGRPALAEMARHFNQIAHMNEALGYAGAVKHWVTGRNGASHAAELSARRWLDLNVKAGIASAEPVAKPLPLTPSAGKLFLVAAPESIAAKVEKVLAMLGCDVTEV